MRRFIYSVDAKAGISSLNLLQSNWDIRSITASVYSLACLSLFFLFLFLSGTSRYLFFSFTGAMNLSTLASTWSQNNWLSTKWIQADLPFFSSLAPKVLLVLLCLFFPSFIFLLQVQVQVYKCTSAPIVWILGLICSSRVLIFLSSYARHSAASSTTVHWTLKTQHCTLFSLVLIACFLFFVLTGSSVICLMRHRKNVDFPNWAVTFVSPGSGSKYGLKESVFQFTYGRAGGSGTLLWIEFE